MWTTIVMFLLIILFFLFIGVLKQKEGFDNPNTVSQQHKGDIASLRKQLNKITISDESLSAIQEQITQLSNNTTTLLTHLPDKDAEQYAPE
jgi:hypothetical protein